MKKVSMRIFGLVGLFGVLFCTYFLRTISDPDLWWHIVIGKWIVAHRAVPWVDYWNAFGVDKPWLAYSWSLEVIFGLIDLRWGVPGLQVAQCLFGLILSFSILGIFITLSRSVVIGSIIGALALSDIYFYFCLRPHVLSWILLAFLILMGEQIRKKVTWRRLFVVSLLIAIWANTNITSVIGTAIVCAWVLDLESMEKVVSSLKICFKVAIAGLIGSLFTPYHGSEWLMAGHTFYHPWLFPSIQEFRPLMIFYDAQAGILLIELVLLGFLLHVKPKCVAPSHILLVVCFAGLGLCVSKFCPIAVIIASSVIAITWAKYLNDPSQLGGIGIGLSMLENRVLALSKLGAIVGSFILILGCAKNVHEAYKVGNYGFDFTPVRALDFVKGHNLPLPITATFGSGGYVLYRFSNSAGVPEFRVPIDGRTNVNNPKVYRLHSAALNGMREWAEFLEKVKSETIVWPNYSPLVSILMLSDDWCSVYDESTDPSVEENFVEKNLQDQLNDDDDEGEKIPFGHSVFVRRAYYEEHKSTLSSTDCSK